MSTTKLAVKQYLDENGYKDFTITKSGSFIYVALWDIITYDEVEKIKTALNEICGKLSDYSWMDRLNLHCRNVRFSR